MEGKDGGTYMKLQSEEGCTQVLLTWFGDQDARKWFHKVRRNVKKIKTNALDDFETDYIDVDVLLNLYLEEFKAKKKSNQKTLSKEFMKKYQEQEGLFSTEDVDRIMLSCMPATSPSVFVRYPAALAFRRAFLYALVAGDNAFDISTPEFIAGCNRFGLDNPSPFVGRRIGLYGNDDEFEDIVKKELIKSNIKEQSKMHTSKVQNVRQGGNLIKLEQARVSSNNVKY